MHFPLLSSFISFFVGTGRDFDPVATLLPRLLLSARSASCPRAPPSGLRPPRAPCFLCCFSPWCPAQDIGSIIAAILGTGLDLRPCFFPNEFPDFVAKTPDGEGGIDRPADLRGVLSLSYPKLSVRFLHAMLWIKDKVVEETWNKAGCQVTDYTITGMLGTMLLLFKSFHVTGNLTLPSAIICKEATWGLL